MPIFLMVLLTPFAYKWVDYFKLLSVKDNSGQTHLSAVRLLRMKHDLAVLSVLSLSKLPENRYCDVFEEKSKRLSNFLGYSKTIF